ncbi:molybdopterin biosynthesis protein, partial [gut metagenome]
MTFRAAILTISDRSSRGERPDGSGPVLVEMLRTAGYEIVKTAIIPDERPEIEAALKAIADDRIADLILTTGGTGFSPRDVT